MRSGTTTITGLIGASLVAAAALFAGGPPAAQAQTRPVTFASGNLRGELAARRRPPTIAFGARTSLTGLRWASWGGRVATATGTVELNDCDPSCAEGSASRYAVRVTLSRVRPCGGGRRYLTMRFAYVGARPAGFAPTYRELFGRLCD